MPFRALFLRALSFRVRASERGSSSASSVQATPTPRSERSSRQALGAEGEKRAARYLARRGYRIVERNVRAGGVEVDLIARRARVVVFVEVKTRRTLRHGAPELAVDAAKQDRLVRAATAWLRGNRGRFSRVRFDVIACVAPVPPAAKWQIEHLADAFGSDR